MTEDQLNILITGLSEDGAGDQVYEAIEFMTPYFREDRAEYYRLRSVNTEFYD